MPGLTTSFASVSVVKNRVIVLSVIKGGLSSADAARRYEVARRWVETLG